MRISICDDDGRELQSACLLVNEYIRLKGLPKEDFQVRKFTNAEDLLCHEARYGAADIYILDIIMKGTDGISLGRTLHERRPQAFILYLTCSREFAVDAFSVKAFSYLLKPVEKSALFRELDLCLGRLDAPGRKITIRDRDGSRTVRMRDIIAVEYFKHRLIYHTADGRLEGPQRRAAFDESVAEFMETGYFLKISASFILNLRRVRNLSGDVFLADDGQRYKVTRRYAAAKKQYLDFVLAGGGYDSCLIFSSHSRFCICSFTR